MHADEVTGFLPAKKEAASWILVSKYRQAKDQYCQRAAGKNQEIERV